MDLLLIQTNSKTTKQYTKTVENVSICGLELLTFVNCLVGSIDCYSHSSLVKKSFSKYLTSTTSTNAACTVLMDHEGLSLAGKLFFHPKIYSDAGYLCITVSKVVADHDDLLTQ